MDEILAASRRASPEECCGLIEGERDGGDLRALALHETKNLASDRAREFLIDPEARFRLTRALRGTGREIIGCFHSHPDGEARPSATDRERASEDRFLWLIAAGSELAAFIYREQQEDFEPAVITGITG